MQEATPVDFEQLEHFLGFDWAREKHHVVAVDRQGRVVLTMQFEQTAEGWATLRDKLRPLGQVGAAIETNCGPAVEWLLELGCQVYPMNPKAAERFRDRKAPSGVKSDQLDAWSFADALRSDGRGWRVLRRDDEHTRTLRMLCRDEIGLIQQRTALVNQLIAALHEYYPAALEAFNDWTMISAWALIERFPTPVQLKNAGKRRWQKFMHTHKLYHRDEAQRRMEIFGRADEFASPSAAVTEAKSMLAASLVKQLRVLQGVLVTYRKKIEQAFAQHPDHALFESLPGTGPKLAPRLLVELGTQRQVFESAQALQCFAGTAPVTKSSGKKRHVFIRWMCNRHLRATIHLWVDHSRHTCAWAQAYYQQKRQAGKSHAMALRCLGQRWLNILWKMWQTRTTYNEARHTLNQVRNGSWVITLLPEGQHPQPTPPAATPTTPA